MPRKSTRKSATTTAPDVKNEEVAPRRSGRAATKQEVRKEKDISRSRRSSTAAQTAASVADSKPGKTRGEASSATDSRTRGGKESGDTSATRATRRSTGRINYKESDGEEEAPTPKYDKNFESGEEEFDDSESDEKSKQQEKNKPTRATKSRAVKEQVEKVTRVRRGRPSKTKTDDTKTVDISDDSMEPEIIETKSDNKSKTQTKRTRGSRSKSEVVDVELESEAKPSRRSARAVSSKEESPKKRPSRGVRAKQYAEEDEVEEILDNENLEIDTKSNSESNRKRKRNSSAQESNKRSKRNERKETKDSEEDIANDKELVEDDEAMEKDAKPEVEEKYLEVKEDSPIEEMKDKIESVEDKTESSDDKIDSIEDEMECTEANICPTDEIECAEEKMESTQDEIQNTQETLDSTKEKLEATQEKFEKTEEKTECIQKQLECSEEKMESDDEIMEVDNKKMDFTQDKTESSKNETESPKDTTESCKDNVDDLEEKGLKGGEFKDKVDIEQSVIENKERKENIEESEEDEPMEVEETDSRVSSEDNSHILRNESDVSDDKENIIENPQENIPPPDALEEITCDSNEPPIKEHSKSETSDLTLNKDSSDYLEAYDPATDSSGTFSNSEHDTQKTKETSISHESSREKIIDGKVGQPIETVKTASEELLQSAVASEKNLQNEKGKFETNESDILNKSETSVKEPNVERNEQVFLPSVQNIQSESAVNFATNMHSSDRVPGLSFNGTEKLGNSVDSAAISRVSSCDEKMETSIPTTNGAHEDVLSNEKQLNYTCYSLPDRKYVCNPKINDIVLQSVKSKTFGFLSYNLGAESGVQKDKLLKEIHDLNSHIVCFQQVPKPFYSSVLEPSLDALGYRSIYSQPSDSLKGMATFFKSSYFSLSCHSDISLRQVIEKELEASSLESTSKAAVKSYIKRCGNALITQLARLNGTQSVAVVNVQIPPSDIGMHALQVSCLAREIIKLNGSASKPLLVGGEFNISQNEASYQLLRDGYLANDMIDELQKRKDIAVPEKENSSLVDLLWKSFQHPSSNLCSCYSSVLGQEIFIPNLKNASPDLLWYSSDSLLTVGVIDVNSEKVNDRHVFLKADVAFSN